MPAPSPKWNAILSAMFKLYNYQAEDVTGDIDEHLGLVKNMDAVEYLKGIPNDSVDLVFTDEPYGVPKTALGGGKNIAVYTDLKWDDDLPAHLTMPWVAEAVRVLKPGGSLINSGLPEYGSIFREVAVSNGCTHKATKPLLHTFIWAKTNAAPQVRKVNYKSAMEEFWWEIKGERPNTVNFLGQLNMRNWEFDTVCPNCGTSHPAMTNEDVSTVSAWMDTVGYYPPPHMTGPSVHSTHRDHPTQKPEWLASKLIMIHTNPGDVVLDPFCGSGVYLAIAHKLQRKALGNDIGKKHARRAQREISNLTLPAALVEPKENVAELLAGKQLGFLTEE